MRIFLLEDDGTRVGLIKDAIADSHIRLDYTSHVEGRGGAKDIFDGHYNLLLLDHDLGGRQFVSQADPETGSAFVQWLVAQYPNGRGGEGVIVHSYNTVAAKAMIETLAENGYDANYIPFGLKLLRHLEDLAQDDND